MEISDAVKTKMRKLPHRQEDARKRRVGKTWIRYRHVTDTRLSARDLLVPKKAFTLPGKRL
jgi:hypothetical protein